MNPTEVLVEQIRTGKAPVHIRRYAAQRHKLHRKPCTVETAWGPVQGKLGWLEGRPPVFSPEYEDCVRVARERGLPLRVVYDAVRAAATRSRGGPAG